MKKGRSAELSKAGYTACTIRVRMGKGGDNEVQTNIWTGAGIQKKITEKKKHTSKH